MLARLFSLLQVLVRRRDFEDGMAEEVRFHVEQYTEDLVRSGVPPAEAARRARIELGSVDNVKADCREARGLRPFDELHQDLRHAARLLRKQAGLTGDEAQGAVYYPYVHLPNSEVFVVARTSLPPESLGITLRNAVRKVDPELPVTDLRSMETRIADSLVARRSPALLAGLFSALALLLTALGTYGVFSYAVAQRRREIGLRMALGARPEQVRRQFLSLSLRLLAAGTVLGVAGAWLAGQALQTILFDVPALHLATLAGAAGILGAFSLAACLLPSGRAARISPLEALAGQ